MLKQTRICGFSILICVFTAHFAGDVFAPALMAQAADTPGPLVAINEVMASNSTILRDIRMQFVDWIELYNAGDMPIDLAGMYLTDDSDEPTMWMFPTDDPAATTIGPKGYLVVWADEDSAGIDRHVNFSLDAQGDDVLLVDTDGMTVIDHLTFGKQTPDVSYGRYPDGGAELRFFGEPTPAQPNNEGYLGQVEPLRFSHERGFYDSSFLLTITCPTEGAEILYTIDGRVPNDDSGRFIAGDPYTSPLWINSTMCVRAMALKPGWKPTDVYTHTYIFHAPANIRSLPVISLVGDERKTFYEPDGVMAIVGGTYSGGVWTSSGVGSYNNVLSRGLERPVSCEWLYPDDSLDFQIDCGLRVHGSDYMRPRYVRQNGLWSGNGKFALRLYFRGEYGTSWLDYPLIPESEVERFKSTVLRAGHNDRTNPFIKDELIRRLMKDMGHVSPVGTMANLFINGEYKGYFNPTEHVKEEACQQWFDSDKPWDVMTMNGIRDGDATAWNAMINYARSSNLAIDMYYQEMGRKLDIPGFIDYLIMRLWPNDWDWPQNNWSAAAERSETGQWKFFIWDAEGTFERNQLNDVRFGELNNQGNANGVLYRALKANANFRQLFGDHLFKHFHSGGALTEENVGRRFHELQEELRGVIPNMDTYIIDTWVPNRETVFLSACVSEGLFTFPGPAFALNGFSKQGGYASEGDWLSINPTQVGASLYYTLDGTNPGTPGPVGPVTLVNLVTREMPKRVLVPTGPVDDWVYGRGFNDSQWILSSGSPGGVGYERGSGYETYIRTDVGDQMYGTNGSCYIRIPFTFSENKDTFDGLMLTMQYDDGFIAYLNGVEIARRNFTGEPAWNSLASGSHDDTAAVAFESINVSDFLDVLKTGSNMLSIHALNVSLTSSDLLNTAELAILRTDVEEPQIDAIHYTSPITLTKTVKIKSRALVGNTWSAMNEAVFSVGPIAESLRISEIMFHPTNTGNPDDPNTEFVELVNTAATPINLNLVSFTKGIHYTFPDFELAPGARCLLARDIAAVKAKYGSRLPVFGQYTGSLDNGGERIELRDAVGGVIEDFTYRDDWYRISDGAGFSLTARDPGGTDENAWSTKDAWRPSAVIGGTPGFDDAGFVPEPGTVVINELLANSSGGDPDWIELHNTADEAVDIGGWFLSDDADDLTRYEIASGTTIAPHGYVILTEDRHFGNGSDPGCHRPFGLSRGGEKVYLHSGSGGVMTGYSEQEQFEASEPGVTLGRYRTSIGTVDFVPMSMPTPGYANAYPSVGPIIINEIMYHPDGAEDAEYVELVNISDREVALYDFVRGVPWRLTDDPDHPTIELQFSTDPPVTMIPGQYLLLVKDLMVFQSQHAGRLPAQIIEWGQGRLSNGGGKIVLAKPGDVGDDGHRQWFGADSVVYSDGSHHADFPGGLDPWPAQAAGQGLSLTRANADHYGNDPGNWQATTPSPGTGGSRSTP